MECRATRANVCIPLGKNKTMSGVGTTSYADGAYAAPQFGMITVDWEAGLSLPQRGTCLRPMFFNSGDYDFWTFNKAENPVDGPADNTYNNIGLLFQSMDEHITDNPAPQCMGVKGAGPNSVAGAGRQ